jgi:hypothetical protein
MESWPTYECWPRSQKLKERSRLSHAIVRSLFRWPPSLEAVKEHGRLAQAHLQIRSLRRQVRRGMAIAEEQEQRPYWLYAKSLNRLLILTGARICGPVWSYDDPQLSACRPSVSLPQNSTRRRRADGDNHGDEEW